MRISPHQGLSFLQDGDRVGLSPFGFLRSRIFAVSPRFFAFLPPLQSLIPGYIRPSQIRQPWDLHTLKSLTGGQLPKSISTGGWHFLIIATIMAITARNPVCLVSTGVVLMSCKFQCVSSLGIPQRWEVQQAYKILRKTIYQLFVKILL